MTAHRPLNHEESQQQLFAALHALRRRLRWRDNVHALTRWGWALLLPALAVALLAFVRPIANAWLWTALAVGGALLGWLLWSLLRPLSLAYERQRAFVGDASHELRSPLAVIRASSELLLRDPLGDQQRESVREIHDTSVEASGLVEDLLLLARLDQGSSQAQEEACDATEVVDDVLEQLAPLIELHGSQVGRAGTSARVYCPESDLRRILRALIENVLAYTPPGTRFEFSTGVEDDHGVITLRDHGPGVPPPSLSTLFDPFTRVSIARTPTEGHSGLGLAIAHRLVSRHGGILEARNHPSGGLETTIRLKRARWRSPSWQRE